MKENPDFNLNDFLKQFTDKKEIQNPEKSGYDNVSVDEKKPQKNVESAKENILDDEDISSGKIGYILDNLTEKNFNEKTKELDEFFGDNPKALTYLETEIPKLITKASNKCNDLNQLMRDGKCGEEEMHAAGDKKRALINIRDRYFKTI